MENCRRKNSCGDKFSFPTMPMQEQSSDFEFGGVTPGSPNSPADHLFFNGRLLPHAFPFQPANNVSSTNYYTRSTSSVSSKDSLMSSRSNSTDSRSSSCSSARTSTSTEASERKIPLMSLQQAKGGSRTLVSRDRYQANKPVLVPQYGSSQRWQFITPSPALNRQASRSKKAAGIVLQEESRVGKNQAKSTKTGASSGFGSRIFRSFVSACKECHAMNPSRRDDVLQGNITLE